MRFPLFAVLAILAALSMMPIGHSLVILLRQIEDPWHWAWANMAIGFSGFALLWLGLKKSELQASVLGFVAAHLMFVGFFEFTFALFAKVFNVQPIISEKTGNVLLSPSLQVNEASFFILVPIFLLFYANRQVRCNMIVWIRKQLRMDIGRPTEAARYRDYARITAAETLFIIWMIYAISLITLDPRVLGPSHWLSMTIYTWFMVWPLYLMYKVKDIIAPGLILRYSIPIGILLWSWVEMFASMNLINEYYLKPLEYPLASGLTAVVALALLTAVYRGWTALK